MVKRFEVVEHRHQRDCYSNLNGMKDPSWIFFSELLGILGRVDNLNLNLSKHGCNELKGSLFFGCRKVETMQRR